MSDPIKPPAARPCGSCPYRQDVPSGVWSRDEYEKLPAFDQPGHPDALTVFLCHQQDGRVCAGWAGCHDMSEAIGPRLAVSMERMSVETYDELLDYETDVPLFPTGAEAAAHGLEAIETPAADARRVIGRLRQKATTRGDDDISG